LVIGKRPWYRGRRIRAARMSLDENLALRARKVKGK